MAKMTEKQFDAIHNENGQGYNPIRAAREARDAAAISAMPVRADGILRQIDALDNSAARESGAYDAAKVAALRARFDAIRASEAAEFMAAWPLELTQARRTAWNAFALANMTKKGLPAALAFAQQKAQGWTTDDLRKAIKLHSL